MKTPFLGIAYLARSRTLASQRLVNLYPEVVESKSGAEVGGFYGCPGTVNKVTVGSGPIRGLLTANGLLYAVSGNTVYSINSSYSATSLGTIGTSTGPVSMIANPTQIAIFDGIGGYSIVAGVLASIMLPFSNPGVASYQDGFGLVNQIGTFNVYQSNLNDLTTWDALNFTTEDGSADNVVSTIEFHNQVVIFKQNHMCFYINAGNSGFAFERLQGVYPQTGCTAPYSPAEINETVLWLGKHETGIGSTVYAIQAYQPERISTHALEYAISQYSTISDAIGFTYTQEGHNFYCLTFPTAGETWCLDLTETKKLGIPAWHQRAGFSNGLFTQYAGQCSAVLGTDVLVGDWNSGNIYKLDLDNYQDNGGTRKWLRSWPALAQDQFAPTKFNWLEFNCETGIGVDPSANPQLVLRKSLDSYNWSPELYQPIGKTGETGNLVRFNRLGSTRRGSNSSMIFELSSTDAFKVALLGAEFG